VQSHHNPTPRAAATVNPRANPDLHAHRTATLRHGLSSDGYANRSLAQSAIVHPPGGYVYGASGIRNPAPPTTTSPRTSRAVPAHQSPRSPRAVPAHQSPQAPRAVPTHQSPQAPREVSQLHSRPTGADQSTTRDARKSLIFDRVDTGSTAMVGRDRADSVYEGFRERAPSVYDGFAENNGGQRCGAPPPPGLSNVNMPVEMPPPAEEAWEVQTYRSNPTPQVSIRHTTPNIETQTTKNTLRKSSSHVSWQDEGHGSKETGV
jgi:hypothetical protein